MSKKIILVLALVIAVVVVLCSFSNNVGEHDYVVLSGYKLDALTAQVNKYLSMGYEPAGGVTTVGRDLVQAVWK